MNIVEFVYSPEHKIRFIRADNTGYCYIDTGDKVESGMLVYQGYKTTFDKFVAWVEIPGRYLFDPVNGRVLKVFKDSDGYHIRCADGVSNADCFPWTDLSNCRRVIIANSKIIFVNDEIIEFIALQPTIPVFNPDEA